MSPTEQLEDLNTVWNNFFLSFYPGIQKLGERSYQLGIKPFIRGKREVFGGGEGKTILPGGARMKGVNTNGHWSDKLYCGLPKRKKLMGVNDNI